MPRTIPRADILVDRLQRWTRNSYLTNRAGELVAGVDPDYILFALNEGKNHIQREIGNVARTPLLPAYVTSDPITTRQLEYPIPDYALISNRIISLAWSPDGDVDRYFRLKQIDEIEFTDQEGDPCWYFVSGSNVVVSPAPTTGYYRFYFQARDDQLDLRRGKIASVAPNGNAPTSITLVDDDLLTNLTVAALGLADTICVCDNNGEIVTYDVPISGYNSGTRVLTVDGVYAADTTIAANDYITIGRRTSTHSQLPMEFHEYIVEWAMQRIKTMDSNSDAVAELPVLTAIKGSLLELFSSTADQVGIPEIGDFTGDWNN